jgi:hypothetical protein
VTVALFYFNSNNFKCSVWSSYRHFVLVLYCVCVQLLSCKPIDYGTHDQHGCFIRNWNKGDAT